MYVDARRLEKGIYTCDKPFIYSKDKTIDELINNTKKVQLLAGDWCFSEQYFENLKQCQLVSFKLERIEP